MFPPLGSVRQMGFRAFFFLIYSAPVPYYNKM